MKTQHEEMVADGAALQTMLLEDLTPASMAAMDDLIEHFAENLALAAGAAQALGKGTSFKG